MTSSSMQIIREFSRFIKEDDPFGIKYVGKSECDEKFFVERKSSDTFSFEYIVKGHGTLEIESKVLHPSTGDIFLLTKGSRHKYFTDKKDRWHKYFFSITGPLADKLKELYIPFDTYLFSCDGVEENFEKIFNYSLDTTLDYEEFVRLSLHEIIDIFIKIKASTSGSFSDTADVIKRKIDYSVEKEFSLDRIAAEMNYTNNHIINIFKAKYGTTPYQYYLSIKFESAKRYLRESSLSVAKISEMLRFADPHYFSSSFKKIVGISPKEYRNASRK